MLNNEAQQTENECQGKFFPRHISFIWSNTLYPAGGIAAAPAQSQDVIFVETFLNGTLSTWQLLMAPDLNTSLILAAGTMKVCPGAERAELPWQAL